MNNDPSSSEHQPGQHEEMSERLTLFQSLQIILEQVESSERPCAGDARKEKNTREDEDDVKSKEGGEEHLAEQFHLRHLKSIVGCSVKNYLPDQHLVVVDVVAADSLAGDELGDVVAVVVEENRHGGEQGGADDNPNLATIRNASQICNNRRKRITIENSNGILG